MGSLKTPVVIDRYKQMNIDEGRKRECKRLIYESTASFQKLNLEEWAQTLGDSSFRREF